MEKLPPTRNVLAQLRCGWEFFYLYTAPAVTRLREEQTGEHSVGRNEARADSHNEQSELGLSTARAEHFRRKIPDNIEKHTRDEFYATLCEIF